jgi:hypothetical protein
MKIISLLTIAFCCLIFVTSCEINEPSQSEIDDTLIQLYWNAHKNDPIFSGKTLEQNNGMYYVITYDAPDPDYGNAECPVVNEKEGIYSTVTISYSGTLLNGTEFDQNDSTSLYLGTVVKGWQLGMPKMKCGDKATFFVPSEMGYQGKTVGDIPANSVLIFNVELMQFQTIYY